LDKDTVQFSDSVEAWKQDKAMVNKTKTLLVYSYEQELFKIHQISGIAMSKAFCR
jgi:hypothetical protein